MLPCFDTAQTACIIMLITAQLCMTAFVCDFYLTIKLKEMSSCGRQLEVEKLVLSVLKGRMAVG